MSKASDKTSVSLREVAKKAKVSVTTASRVLNGSSIPTKKTKQKVLKAASKLNYQADPALSKAVQGRRHGKAAPHKQTGLIGLLSSADSSAGFYRDDSHFGSALRSIQEVLNENDYHLILHEIKDNQQVPDLVAQGKVDGLLAWGDWRNIASIKYSCQQLPTVFIESSISSTKHSFRADSVMSNAELAMQKQLEYLWELGHRKIAYFEQSTSSAPQQARLQGFNKFLASHNTIDLLAELNTPRDITHKTHEKVLEEYAQELLNSPIAPTALISSSVYALHLMNLLQERGVKVPDDISIISANDDWRSGHLSRPALTAYYMPMDEVGKKAAQLLIERIEEPALPSRHLQVDGYQIERASCDFLNDTNKDLGKTKESTAQQQQNPESITVETKLPELVAT